ncbi:MAG: hypothetical protein H0W41_05480 [Chloroflexi bacterium]|nr:hypothetical protein [Chloroflexota bacterium]
MTTPSPNPAIPSAEQARLSSAIAGACIAGIDRVVHEAARRQREEVYAEHKKNPLTVSAARGS